MKNYQQIYQDAYNKLNPNQQKAVDHIEGPIMVIAGPGTGKTQVLSIRIAKMILQTDINPYNILCLTFTDAAAVNMRQRLASFVGSIAHKVNIETFHSFCNRVIESYKETLGINDFEVMSELEEYEIFQQLIADLPSNHILKKLVGDTFFIWQKLRTFFNDLEKENWEHILPQKIDEYLQAILDDPEKYANFYYKRDSQYGKKGALKQKEYESVKEDLQKTKAAVALYPTYKKILKEKKVYTFNDMLLWTIQLFQEKPEILLRYQERFQYVCVDEYQDTSSIQRNIIELLMAYWQENANIFVVGDDDQSIYRFQGASMQNIELFIKQYEPQLTKIVIDTNYRSTPEILHCAEVLIAHNEERICNQDNEFNKQLHSPITNNSSKPTIAVYENYVEEALHITHQIKYLIEEKKVLPENIAVLYRNHRMSGTITQFLSKEKIPFQLSRSVNILDEPLIQKIIILLEYIAIEGDNPWKADNKLFEILHFDMYTLSATEVAMLSLKAGKRNIRQIIAQQVPKDFFKSPAGKEITRIFQIVEALIKDLKNHTVQTFLLEVVQKTDMLQYVMQSEDRLWNLELLNSFFNFIKQETAKHKEMTIKQLLQHIREYQYRNLPITLTRTIAVENGISLMTCHKAKGLEFEYVFMLGCNAEEWEKKRNNTNSFKIPDNMYYHTPDNDNDREEEERRLFFVGITRAKKELYISYSKYNDKKALTPSKFVTEIEEQNTVDPLAVLPLSEAQQADTLSTLLQKEEIPKIALIEKQLIDEVLEKYVLAPTHLNTFLECPIQFYYNQIIKAPGVMNANATYGSAVHAALEKIMPSFDKQTNTKTTLGTVDELVQYFLNYMLANKEVFTDKEFEIFKERGATNLKAFYTYKLEEWKNQTVIMTEIDTRRMGTILIEDVPVRGVLDKLIFQGNHVTIIDYKTGRFSKSKKEKKRFDRPLELLDSSLQQKITNKYGDTIPQNIMVGGEYWRQAVFYKLLLERIPYKMWKGDTIIFQFVEQENGEFYEEKIVVTEADEQFLKKQIKEAYHKIKNHQFYTGCGNEDCSWCNFVQSYQLDITTKDDDETIE